jgi:hypothetical protein
MVMHYQPLDAVREQILLHGPHVSPSDFAAGEPRGRPATELTGSWDEDESLPAISKTKVTRRFDLEGSYDF